MTKKELLENKWFAMAPDNTEIVFRTDNKVAGCLHLEVSHLSLQKEIINEKELEDRPWWMVREAPPFKPIYMTAIVIEAMPLDYMKEKYNTTFKFK